MPDRREDRGDRPTISTVRRASVVVAVGSIGGHGLGLVLVPLLTRLYSPEVFGLFAAVLAVATTFVGVSTFRLEVLAQREPEPTVSLALVHLGLIASLCWGLLLSAAAAAAWFLGLAPALSLVVGVLVVVGSLQLLGTAALARDARYTALAGANLTQGGGTAVAQVALGAMWPAAPSLLAGFVLGRSGWLLPVARSRSSREAARSAATRARGFAPAAGASAFVNSLAGQLLVLVVSTFYGSLQVGLVALALRVLVSPLSVLGQAMAAAVVGEIGRSVREGRRDVGLLVRGGMRDLFLIGVVPCGLAAGLGPLSAEHLLGPGWADAGYVVAVLSAGALAQFAVAPMAQTLNLVGSHRRLLVWDLLRLLLIVASLGVAVALGASIIVAVACYSGAMVCAYLALAWLLFRTMPRAG